MSSIIFSYDLLVGYPLCWIVFLYPLFMLLLFFDVAKTFSSFICLLDLIWVSLTRKESQKSLFWGNQINPFLGLMIDVFWVWFRMFSPKLSWQIHSSKLPYTNFIIFCLHIICSFLSNLKFFFIFDKLGNRFHFSIYSKQIFLTSFIRLSKTDHVRIKCYLFIYGPSFIFCVITHHPGNLKKVIAFSFNRVFSNSCD